MKRQKQHNYLGKIEKLVQDGVIPHGSFADVAILHAPSRTLHQGGFCDCDPDVRAVGESDE